jgi:Tol biopolymer transport system component
VVRASRAVQTSREGLSYSEGFTGLPVISPSGDALVFARFGALYRRSSAESEADIRLYAIKPGERTARALTKRIAVRDYTFCPDGKHLVLTAVPGTP